MIAGVCAGLAQYLGWDVSITRLAFLGVSILSAGFPGILVYVILCERNRRQGRSAGKGNRIEVPREDTEGLGKSQRL